MGDTGLTANQRTRVNGTYVADLDGLYYLPVLLVDDKGPDATGELSLFVRGFKIVERKRGRVAMVTADVWTFEDATALAETIDRLGMIELPPEADDDVVFLPDRFRDVDKVERRYGRVIDVRV
jgi:hypothetical protein